MNPEKVTLEGRFQAYQQLQQNFNNAKNEIITLRTELQGTKNDLGTAQSALLQNMGKVGPRCKAHESYKGKGSISS